jgi:hypothetical protein
VQSKNTYTRKTISAACLSIFDGRSPSTCENIAASITDVITTNISQSRVESMYCSKKTIFFQAFVLLVCPDE